MRLRRLLLAAVLINGLLLGLIAGRIHAAENQQGDQCLVPTDMVITADYYVLCNTLIVQGTIEGDLIGAAWATVLEPGSTITGDVWLIGGQLQVSGRAEDDIHFAGLDLDITETSRLSAGLDVTAAGLNAEIWSGATVPGDLLMLGYQAVVRGDVTHGINFNGAALVIEGQVAGDVYAQVGSGDGTPSVLALPFPFSISFQAPGLTMLSGSEITGNLTYAGPRPGNISGRIGGETAFDLVQPRPDITQSAAEVDENQFFTVVGRYLLAVITDVFAMLAAGVLVLLLAPRWLSESAELIPRFPLTSVGWGVILGPVIAAGSIILMIISLIVLLFVSVITLGGFTLMALLLLAMINVVFVAMGAFIITFVARLVLGMLVGQWLGRRFIHLQERWAVNLLALVLGTGVLALLTNIPLPQVGLVIYWVSTFIGLGALAIRARQLYRQQEGGLPIMPQLAERVPLLESAASKPPPPPPLDSHAPNPGMDNLPQGFNWWESDQKAGAPPESQAE